MDKLWVIVNKFRGGHKRNMQISGRGTSFKIATQRMELHTDTSIFMLLNVTRNTLDCDQTNYSSCSVFSDIRRHTY